MAFLVFINKKIRVINFSRENAQNISYVSQNLRQSLQRFSLFKVQFFIHCTNFLDYYSLLDIQQNFINLVSLENHGRVEYYNGKYFAITKD